MSAAITLHCCTTPEAAAAIVVAVAVAAASDGKFLRQLHEELSPRRKFHPHSPHPPPQSAGSRQS
jgi:hypothetical protein